MYVWKFWRKEMKNLLGELHVLEVKLEKEFKDLKHRYLAKDGSMMKAISKLKDLTAEERAVVGSKINELKEKFFGDK